MAFGIVLSTLLIASSSFYAPQSLDQAQIGVPIRIGSREYVPSPAVFLSPGTVNPEFSPDSNWAAWAAPSRDGQLGNLSGESLQALSLPGATAQNILYRLNTGRRLVETCLTCPPGEQLADYRFLGVGGELVATTINAQSKIRKLYYVSGPNSARELLSVPLSTEVNVASSPNSRTVYAALLDNADQSPNNLTVFRLDAAGIKPVSVTPGVYEQAFFSGNTVDGAAILELTPRHQRVSTKMVKIDYRSGVPRLLPDDEWPEFIPTNGNAATIRLSLKMLKDFPDRYALYIVENRKDTRAFEMSVGVRGILGNTPDQKVVVYWNSEGSFCRWLMPAIAR